MSRLAAFQKPLALSIAENATTPAASAPGVEIWSTTAGKKLIWNGTAWVAAAGGSGASTSVAFADYVNRRFPAIVEGTPSGAAQGVGSQPADFDARVRSWTVSFAGSTTPTLWGFANNTFGSVTGAGLLSGVPNLDDSTRRQKREARRIWFTTTAVAGATAGWRHGAGAAFLSNGLHYGGFFFAARFAFGSLNTTQHWFVGLSSTLTAFASNPISMQNCIGFAQGSTAGMLALVCNGTANNTTYVSEVGLPTRNAAHVDTLYDVFLYNPQQTKTLYWGCRLAGCELQPTTLRSYSYAADAPGTNVPTAAGLGPQCWSSNGVTANSVVFELSRVTLETWG